MFYPLLLAVLLSATAATATALWTQDIATGAQVGGTLGGSAAVLLAYVMWRLS